MTSARAPQRVLVVDDEPMVREVVARYLERDGFEVRCVGDGAVVMDELRDRPADLVVLDLMLPGRDGLTLLQEMRRNSTVPVILLTARDEEADRVLGLELGADDYVVKPFSPRELAARVKSVLRRATATPAVEPMSFGDIVIEPATREVTRAGEPVELTPKEFDLLAYFAANPRQVFTRAQILDQVWDSSPEWQDPSTVTVHVGRLRSKIEDDPHHPRHLITVWGVGYRLQP